MGKNKETLLQVVDRVNIDCQQYRPCKPDRKQVNITLNEIEQLKLEHWGRETGLSKNTIIRRLIDDGNVNVRYDAKKIMQNIIKIHDDFNQYNHNMENEIVSLQKIIRETTAQIDRYGENLDFKIFLKNANFLIDQMTMHYIQTRSYAEMEMKRNVDI